MINWIDQDFHDKGGKFTITKTTFQETCNLIKQHAMAKEFLPYSQLINELKKKGFKNISRRTIGSIVGEVSDQVSSATIPSVYPSAIVVHKWTRDTGKGFWTLEEGTLPPKAIPNESKRKALDQYQENVFEKSW